MDSIECKQTNERTFLVRCCFRNGHNRNEWYSRKLKFILLPFVSFGCFSANKGGNYISRRNESRKPFCTANSESVSQKRARRHPFVLQWNKINNLHRRQNIKFLNALVLSFFDLLTVHIRSINRINGTDQLETRKSKRPPDGER